MQMCNFHNPLGPYWRPQSTKGGVGGTSNNQTDSLHFSYVQQHSTFVNTRPCVNYTLETVTSDSRGGFEESGVFLLYIFGKNNKQFLTERDSRVSNGQTRMWWEIFCSVPESEKPRRRVARGQARRIRSAWESFRGNFSLYTFYTRIGS